MGVIEEIMAAVIVGAVAIYLAMLVAAVWALYEDGKYLHGPDDH